MVEVRQDAHYLREAVHLADVEELESLHLEAKARVDEQQDLCGGNRTSEVNVMAKKVKSSPGTAGSTSKAVMRGNNGQ